MFASVIPCGAQTDHYNIFSVDLSYTVIGLINHGGGIGLGFEKKAVDWLSFTGVFGHMTFLTSLADVYCTSVSISLFSNYYPLSSGLDKLYVSIGGGCDFMNYFGSGVLPDPTQDILISFTPLLGWKFYFLQFFMLDISAGYKFVITDTFNYSDVKDYVYSGWRFNIGIKFLFGRKEEL